LGIVQTVLLAALASVMAAAMPTAGAAAQDEPARRRGYINSIPAETPEVRRSRHALVAERRKGIMLLVHRGASKFAPENTLEAYSIAMDRGADGCEIDIRATKDGVLYLHHDDELGRVVQGSGKLKDMTYYELLGHRLKGGGAATRVPTLAALLELARKSAMLLHLDIKEHGLEEQISKMMEEAEMWDHIIMINPLPTSDKIRFDPRVKPYDYKGWFNEAGTSEESRKSFMQRPGQMLFVKDDPAEAAEFLGRKPKETQTPLPPGLLAVWQPDGPSVP